MAESSEWYDFKVISYIFIMLVKTVHVLKFPMEDFDKVLIQLEILLKFSE